MTNGNNGTQALPPTSTSRFRRRWPKSWVVLYIRCSQAIFGLTASHKQSFPVFPRYSMIQFQFRSTSSILQIIQLLPQFENFNSLSHLIRHQDHIVSNGTWAGRGRSSWWFAKRCEPPYRGWRNPPHTTVEDDVDTIRRRCHHTAVRDGDASIPLS